MLKRRARNRRKSRGGPELKNEEVRRGLLGPFSIVFYVHGKVRDFKIHVRFLAESLQTESLMAE